MMMPGPFELLLGFLCLGVLVLIVVAVVLVVIRLTRSPAPNVDQRIPCPQCGESIAAGAQICRFCQARLNPSRPGP